MSWNSMEKALYNNNAVEDELKKKKVLLITSSVDDTATYFIDRFSENADFFRLDVDKLDKYQISVTEKKWIITSGYDNITEEEAYSIYYRKPILPNLQIYDSQYHTMIQRDIIAVINGLSDSFRNTVLTRPSILRKVENKVFQLMYAKENGFLLPQSYIGNSVQEIQQFKGYTAIIKPITTGKTYGHGVCEIYQTNIFQGCDEDISLTPLYLQEYIPKRYEVRLTIVSDTMFSVRIDSKNKIDWRADYSNHQYSLVEVPASIEKRCFQLMKDFDISFGAFDFIVTPSGEWVFLEVNPNGQWLWLEQKLKINISDRIFDLLVR